MEITNDTPLVSVCVVTYNHERYIEECLLSVLRQDGGGSIEIIVGEDCSTDGTRQIIERLAREYPGVIFPVYNDTNIGASKNYLLVHGLARGKFIAHLDGDDFWFPGKLKAQVDYLLKNMTCSAVYTNAMVVDVDGGQLGNFCDCSRDSFDMNYFISGANFLPNSSLMYRAQYRGRLFHAPREILVDYEVHLMILQCGSAGFIDRCLVGYRAGVPSSAISKNSELVSDEIFRSLTNVRTHVDPYCFSRGLGVQKANRFLNLLLQERLADAVRMPFVSVCGESRLLALKSMAGELTRRVWVKVSGKLFGSGGRMKVFYPAPR